MGLTHQEQLGQRHEEPESGAALPLSTRFGRSVSHLERFIDPVGYEGQRVFEPAEVAALVKYASEHNLDTEGHRHSLCPNWPTSTANDREHCQRHVPVELDISRLIHLAHPALADEGGHVVVSERSPTLRDMGSLGLWTG